MAVLAGPHTSGGAILGSLLAPRSIRTNERRKKSITEKKGPRAKRSKDDPHTLKRKQKKGGGPQQGQAPAKRNVDINGHATPVPVQILNPDACPEDGPLKPSRMTPVDLHTDPPLRVHCCMHCTAAVWPARPDQKGALDWVISCVSSGSAWRRFPAILGSATCR